MLLAEFYLQRGTESIVVDWFRGSTNTEHVGWVQRQAIVQRRLDKGPSSPMRVEKEASNWNESSRGEQREDYWIKPNGVKHSSVLKLLTERVLQTLRSTSDQTRKNTAKNRSTLSVKEILNILNDPELRESRKRKEMQPTVHCASGVRFGPVIFVHSEPDEVESGNTYTSYDSPPVEEREITKHLSATLTYQKSLNPFERGHRQRRLWSDPQNAGSKASEQAPKSLRAHNRP
eukprot:CAMPEP_0184678638 /NCGR_PEP_ID=MMETSP0312-20130426/1402_1 /TAXON_ID=31354 /ORGANISM="Compsopogon coeruleus, Strain SAG 36.94" /LENGTH=231 /DNA_ID=CAMNT_0027127523 /DNA_START=9 /DNA_END=704 /DNA_ORIENTATION=+